MTIIGIERLVYRVADLAECVRYFEDFGLKMEPGVGIPLSQPQSQRFDLGGGATAKLLYGLGRHFDVTAGVSATIPMSSWLHPSPSPSPAPVAGSTEPRARSVGWPSSPSNRMPSW